MNRLLDYCLENRIRPRALLSTLWIYVLLNMILRDLHEFPTEGFIDELISLKLSEGTMLFYAFIVEIPIAMIPLTRVLNSGLNKWINILAALVTALGVFYTVPSGDMDEVFFGIVNSIGLMTIILIAWQLPRLDQNIDKVPNHC